MLRARIVSVAAAIGLCFVAARDGTPQEIRDSGEHPAYVLAAEDTIAVRVPIAEEFATEKAPFRIDGDGYANLPLVGRTRAAGLSVKQLEAELAKKLKTYYLDPQVSVSVVEFHTQPVSILGSVNNPGLQRVTSRETIVEGLSRAGGLRVDAGNTVAVTRHLEYGRIPLAAAKDDPTGKFSVVELSLPPILSGERAADNIVLEPHDVVTVSRAPMVYVLGEVNKTGGFVLNDKQDISALKALALAGGLARNSAPGRARILRREAGANQRRDIPVNLSRIMKNKDQDMALQPEDILYIPGDLTKKIASRTIEAAIGVGSGVAIWRVSN